MMTPEKRLFFQKQLLQWYNQYQRALPWRAVDVKPNPYYVWLSEIMLQQTTVVTVIPYFNRFIKKWPTITHLAHATQDEVFHLWQGLGYYQRARNLLKCAQVIESTYQSVFPEDLSSLLSLPGIGPYTAAAIRTIAFNQPETVVDGNIESVLSRYLCFDGVFPKAKKQFSGEISEIFQVAKPGDLAQSIMDLGSMICKPTSPSCTDCPIQQKCCAFASKNTQNYPKKAPKTPKPTRYSSLFWIENNKSQVYIRKRTEGRLLLGLMEFPSTPWLESNQSPADGDIKVMHTFTHFHLILEIIKTDAVPVWTQGGFWCDKNDLENYAFPTVMRKVIRKISDQY